MQQLDMCAQAFNRSTSHGQITGQQNCTDGHQNCTDGCMEMEKNLHNNQCVNSVQGCGTEKGVNLQNSTLVSTYTENATTSADIQCQRSIKVQIFRPWEDSGSKSVKFWRTSPMDISMMPNSASNDDGRWKCNVQTCKSQHVPQKMRNVNLSRSMSTSAETNSTVTSEAQFPVRQHQNHQTVCLEHNHNGILYSSCIHHFPLGCFSNQLEISCCCSYGPSCTDNRKICCRPSYPLWHENRMTVTNDHCFKDSSRTCQSHLHLCDEPVDASNRHFVPRCHGFHIGGKQTCEVFGHHSQEAGDFASLENQQLDQVPVNERTSGYPITQVDHDFQNFVWNRRHYESNGNNTHCSSKSKSYSFNNPATGKDTCLSSGNDIGTVDKAEEQMEYKIETSLDRERHFTNYLNGTFAQDGCGNENITVPSCRPMKSMDKASLTSIKAPVDNSIDFKSSVSASSTASHKTVRKAEEVSEEEDEDLLSKNYSAGGGSVVYDHCNKVGSALNIVSDARSISVHMPETENLTNNVHAGIEHQANKIDRAALLDKNDCNACSRSMSDFSIETAYTRHVCETDTLQNADCILNAKEQNTEHIDLQERETEKQVSEPELVYDPPLSISEEGMSSLYMSNDSYRALSLDNLEKRKGAEDYPESEDHHTAKSSSLIAEETVPNDSALKITPTALSDLRMIQNHTNYYTDIPVENMPLDFFTDADIGLEQTNLHNQVRADAESFSMKIPQNSFESVIDDVLKDLDFTSLAHLVCSPLLHSTDGYMSGVEDSCGQSLGTSSKNKHSLSRGISAEDNHDLPNVVKSKSDNTYLSFRSTRTSARPNYNKKRKFHKRFPKPLPGGKRRAEINKNLLVEAARNFLQGYDVSAQRSCKRNNRAQGLECDGRCGVHVQNKCNRDAEVPDKLLVNPVSGNIEEVIIDAEMELQNTVSDVDHQNAAQNGGKVNGNAETASGDNPPEKVLVRREIAVAKTKSSIRREDSGKSQHTHLNLVHKITAHEYLKGKYKARDIFNNFKKGGNVKYCGKKSQPQNKSSKSKKRIKSSLSEGDERAKGDSDISVCSSVHVERVGKAAAGGQLNYVLKKNRTISSDGMTEHENALLKGNGVHSQSRSQCDFITVRPDQNLQTVKGTDGKGNKDSMEKKVSTHQYCGEVAISQKLNVSKSHGKTLSCETITLQHANATDGYTSDTGRTSLRDNSGAQSLSACKPPDSAVSKGNQCKLCDQVFYHRSVIKHHMMQHGEWCIRCRKQFPNKEDRRKHLRRNHDVKLFCGTCALSFVYRSSYRKHLTTKHHLNGLKQAKWTSTQQSPTIVRCSSDSDIASAVAVNENKTSEGVDAEAVNPLAECASSNQGNIDTYQDKIRQSLNQDASGQIADSLHRNPTQVVVNKVKTCVGLCTETSIRKAECASQKQGGINVNMEKTGESKSKETNNNKSNDATFCSKSKKSGTICFVCKKRLLHMRVHLKSRKHQYLESVLKTPIPGKRVENTNTWKAC